MKCECGSRIFMAMRQRIRDETFLHGSRRSAVYVICFQCANCHSSHCYIGARRLPEEDHVGIWVLVEGQPDSTYEAFQTILARAQENDRQAHSAGRLARWWSNTNRAFSKMCRPES